MAIRDNEERLRQDINVRYAYEHQYKPVGQIYLNGKFFAEVNEAGGYELARNLPHLSDNSLKPQERLKEIASALKGKGNVEVKLSDFGPNRGGWSGPAAPESMLPPFTARSHDEILKEVLDMAANKRSGLQR